MPIPPSQRRGRPKRGSAPAFDQERARDMLIRGVHDENGKQYYPTYVEIAKLLDCKPNQIGNLARSIDYHSLRAITPPLPDLNPTTNPVLDDHDLNDDPEPPSDDFPSELSVADWSAIDHSLVFGEELVTTKEGNVTYRYPSANELAKRYAIPSHRITHFARKHSCLERRREIETREQELYAQSILDRRVSARLLNAERVVTVIDDFVNQFAINLRDGNVRTDSVPDFNMMVRLREFIRGNADSRTEVGVTLSLKDLQARHLEIQSGSDDDELGGVEMSGARASLEDMRQSRRAHANARFDAIMEASAAEETGYNGAHKSLNSIENETQEDREDDED